MFEAAYATLLTMPVPDGLITTQLLRGVADRDVWRIENPIARAEFEEAVREYRVAAKPPCADERPCPVCGRAMEPGHRFCELAPPQGGGYRRGRQCGGIGWEVSS